MEDNAWGKQSASLVEVQKFGTNLETRVRDLLGWKGGRVIYDARYGYDVQVDCAYPSLNNPIAVASITYSNPETPGHSNENKLQLKLGELALLKWAYPSIKSVLVIGGTQQAWLPYVLKAFQYFYDDVIFLWNEADVGRLGNYVKNPSAIPSRHAGFWSALRSSFNKRKMCTDEFLPPKANVRYGVMDILRAEHGAGSPAELKHELVRACMMASKSASGTEWRNFLDKNWNAIEMSRSYYNPVEAAVEIILKGGNFDFQGGLAKDVEVRSLLHDLGMSKTKLSEDFVLYSETKGKPVYIQCKSSGGGKKQHGKNIQNRTKEQIARNILYSAKLDATGNLVWQNNNHVWVGIVDGNWGVSKKQPHKYVRMLQLAGYDHIIGAGEILDSEYLVNRTNNSLLSLLSKTLRCRTQPE